MSETNDAKTPPSKPLSLAEASEVQLNDSRKQDSLCTTPHNNTTKPASGSGVTSPSDGANPFASFPLQQLSAAPASNNGGGRRASSVSFGGGVDLTAALETSTRKSGGDISPTGVASALMPPSHAHTSHATKNNVYRAARDAYYHHFEESSGGSSMECATPKSTPSKNGTVRDASGNATENVRCHQLAVASLALSYLLADLEQTKGKFPSLRVTHEDIISALKLPLSYLAHSHLTFHELHAIVSAFVAADDRFKEYQVRAISFDTKRADMAAALTLIEEETGRRASALSPTELRTTISDDGLSFHRVKIACFDSETVAAENVIEIDSSEMSELLCSIMTEGVREVDAKDGEEEYRRRPATRSGCAVIADIHKAKNSIQLLSATSVEPLKMKRSDVPLKIFHDALSVRNPASHRAQGIIEIWKKDTSAAAEKEGATTGISIGIGAETMTKVLATSSVDTELTASDIRNVFGQRWYQGTSWTDPRTCPLEYHDYTISINLLCTAVAFHLINPTRTPSIDVNAIVSELKLPANQILLGRTLHCQQWFAMVQCLAEHRNCTAEYIPFARLVKKTGATPFVSVETLSTLVENVVSRTKSVVGGEGGETSRGLVMMVSFNGNKARQSLNYVAPGENPISYAIVAGYDEENQLVLLADCDTKRNELHWACSLDNLHSALVDHGIIIIADGPEAAETLKDIQPNLDDFTRAAKRVPKYIPTQIQSLGAAEALSSGTPLALCAVASTRLGAAISLDDFTMDLPCNISHALFPYMTLFDLARLFNNLSARRGLKIIASATSLSTDRAMHRKISQVAFTAKLKAMVEDDAQQVIVYYSRFLLSNAPPLAAESSHQCPNYALVLGMPNEETVLLADTNPCQENSKFQVHVNELFRACEDVCQVSRRPKGFLCLKKDTSGLEMYSRANHGAFRDLHLRTLTSHAFRPVGAPQLQALAMGFTALGFPTQASKIFYCGVEHGGEVLTNQLLPMSGLRKRLTIDALIALGSTYAEKVLDGSVELSRPPGSSRGGQLTKDDVRELLLSKSESLSGSEKDEKSSVLQEVLVCVYDVRNAYDVPLEFVSAGVFAGVDSSTKDAVFVEAEPSSWGEHFVAPPAIAAECMLRDPDDSDWAKFGLVLLKLANKEKK